MRLTGHVDAEDLGVARVDREQRREHPQHRRLAGTVRTEDAEDLALAHLEVDAVDGPQVAEGLHQAACLDSGCSDLCHGRKARRPRFHHPYVAVSWPRDHETRAGQRTSTTTPARTRSTPTIFEPDTDSPRIATEARTVTTGYVDITGT